MRIPIVGTIQTKITDNRNRDMNPVPYFGYLENMFRFDVFKDRLIKLNRLIDNSSIIRDPILSYQLQLPVPSSEKPSQYLLQFQE